MDTLFLYNLYWVVIAQTEHRRDTIDTAGDCESAHACEHFTADNDGQSCHSSGSRALYKPVLYTLTADYRCIFSLLVQMLCSVTVKC